MISIIQYHKKIKPNKDHICNGCGTKIKKGESCYCSKFAESKVAYNIYECEKCANFIRKECIKCNGFSSCIGEDYYIGSLIDCNLYNKEDK